MRKSLILISILIYIVSVLCWLLYPEQATSGDYLDSAHGDTTIGVLRTSLFTAPNNYARGNCAHCHEQHASIGGDEPVPNSPVGPDFYLLFQDLWTSPIQSGVFCYGCHRESGSCEAGTGSCQYGGQVLNYSYSNKAGGDSTLACPDNIYQSFQFIDNAGNSVDNGCGSTVGSSHRFGDFSPLVGHWGFSNEQNKVNPCSACHNPHRVQKDPHTSTGRIVDGKLVSAVSMPSQHTSLITWGLWGDDTSERMNAYTPNYWAPKRADSGYEPDASSTQDGSNLVDYVSLCTDCHNSTRVIYSTTLGRNLYKIDWSGFGDFHGGRPRIDNGGDFSGVGEYGDLLEPYKVSGSYAKTNYVLSCTDCHEPHGSPNEFLLRPTVNGVRVNVDHPPSNGGISGAQWYYWCRACHSTDTHTYPTLNCFGGPSGGCHRHCEGSRCSSSNLF